MKKIIFGIFAHPDDEAFGGPCGALIQEVENGAELHLIILTAGEAGTNPDNLDDLGAARLEEWREAGKIIGATTMHHLDYTDGHLDNHAMITAGQRILEIVKTRLVSVDTDRQIEFITMDFNGVTGHIDHIVAARAAAWAFYRLKTMDSRIHRLRLACYPSAAFPKVSTDWIFMEPGRRPEEIGQTIDTRHLKDRITRVIRAHYTQRRDGDEYLQWQGDNLGMCYFVIKE